MYAHHFLPVIPALCALYAIIILPPCTGLLPGILLQSLCCTMRHGVGGTVWKITAEKEVMGHAFSFCLPMMGSIPI